MRSNQPSDGCYELPNLWFNTFNRMGGPTSIWSKRFARRSDLAVDAAAAAASRAARHLNCSCDTIMLLLQHLCSSNDECSALSANQYCRTGDEASMEPTNRSLKTIYAFIESINLLICVTCCGFACCPPARAYGSVCVRACGRIRSPFQRTTIGQHSR
jgi:hypothetical protein